MRIIAVASGKGGVGKTTTVCCLAGALAEAGQRVLVVDLDPAAATSYWLAGEESDRLLAVLADGAPLAPLARPSSASREIDVVAAGRGLYALERSSADLHAGLALGEALAGLPRRWSFVLLDTPGALSLQTGAALRAAGEALLTVQPTPLGVRALDAALDRVALVRRCHPALAHRVLAVMCDLRWRVQRELLAELRERQGAAMLGPFVRQNVRLAEAAAAGLPIGMLDRRSKGGHDYRAVAAELLGAAAGVTVARPASAEAATVPATGALARETA